MSTTKDMLETYIKDKGGLSREIHPYVNMAVDCIAGEVSSKLKLSIALSELITVTAHMRKNIELHDGTLVPCNAITFSLAGSGQSKDASMNQVRKALKPGYTLIEDYRKELAQHKAEQRAVLDGKHKGDWLGYYEEPRPLQASLGTPEGLQHHFADLETGDVGSAFISTSEIGSELQTNGSLTEIVKLVSVGYDLGKIGAKIIKSAENQTPGIECLPINALLFGSHEAILYDNLIKAKFKTIFNTQLARRTIFAFSPETVPPLDFNSIEAINKYRNTERNRTVAAQLELSTNITDVIKSTNQDNLQISEQAQTLFDVYKELNTLLANDMSARYPINKLARRHRQWTALKLSGNYAILDGNEEVTERDYARAINTIEMFTEDLQHFEEELVKEQYEVFSEFVKHNAENGKYEIGLHALRKLGYIPTTGSPKSKIEELVTLVSSYDPDGIYTACNDNGICYSEVIKTDIAGLSYMEVSGSKSQRAKQCASGFEFYETDFEELGNMLVGDYAYSPFRFKDGVRSKDNIIGGAKFIALDIDQSSITDEDCHLLLEGVNHHIARTSDKSNQFKFRVLIELDSIVDIEDKQWRYFIEDISTHLGLITDLLPKSQIYFAYEGRDVLSELEGEPLETKEFIVSSAERLVTKPTAKKLTTTQQRALLDDRLETFSFAYNQERGGRSRALIRAAYYARDLGADEEYMIDLMTRISTYWVDFSESLDGKAVELVKNQIRRF